MSASVIGLTTLFVPPAFAQECQPDEIQTFAPNDPESTLYFGRFTAVSGNRLLAGDPRNDEVGHSAGAAYLFNLATGEQTSKIFAHDTIEHSEFGSAVAFSDVDPNIAIIGSTGQDDHGAVYVFDLSTGEELMKLVGSLTEYRSDFGSSLAVADNRLLVGAPLANGRDISSGEVYLFDLETGKELWRFKQYFDTRHENMGRSVALVDNLVIAGAPGADGIKDNAGVVYVFNAETHNPLYKLMAPDGSGAAHLGEAVAVSGHYLVAGAPQQWGTAKYTGAAYVFDLRTGEIVYKLRASDEVEYGRYGSAIDTIGDFALIGAQGDTEFGNNAGAVYVVDLRIGEEIMKLISSHPAGYDNFGAAIATDGNTAMISAIGDDTGSIVQYAMNCTTPYVGTLDVRPNPIWAGTRPRFTVTDALPNTNSWLAYSTEGNAPRYVPQLDMTINLRSPKAVGPPKVTDAAGSVEWRFLIPRDAEGLHAFFQVVQYGNKTNVFSTPIK